MSLKWFILLPICTIIARQFLIFMQDPSSAWERAEKRLENVPNSPQSARLDSLNLDEIVIAVVACGNDKQRLEELTVVLKSALIFSKLKRLKFLIFTDLLASAIEKVMKTWQHTKVRIFGL